MEYKKIKTSYFIIDTYPFFLKTDIPLLDIIIKPLYFISGYINLFKNSLLKRKKLNLSFQEKEEIDGKEEYRVYDINLNIKKDEEKEEVIKTFIEYYKNDKAKNLLESIILDRNDLKKLKLSNNFILKERVEVIKTSKKEKESRQFEIKSSYPTYAIKFAKFLKLPKLKELGDS